MKRRIISNAVLSAVLLAGGALSSPVLAENTTSGSTQINYTVDESYAWTAPANITFTADSNGSEAKTATIEVTQNTIGSGKTLKIGIASDQAFDLTDSANDTNKREYTVKDGSTALSAGSEVLSIEAGTNTGKKDLTLQMVQAPVEVAGSYAGTLKFVSAIESTGSESGGSGGETSIIDGTNVMLSNDVNGNGQADKGDTITFAREYLYSGSNTGPTEFLVLNSDGSTAELTATTNYQNSKFNRSSVTTTDSAGNTVQKYEGSTLDTLLNSTYYSSLSSTVQSKIQAKAITQNSWTYGNSKGSDLTITNFDSYLSLYRKIGTVSTYDRNVYALDIQDIVDYLGTSTTGAQVNKMFFGTEEAVSQYVWLRSAYSHYSYCAFRLYGGGGDAYDFEYDDTYETRPAFTITLN